MLLVCESGSLITSRIAMPLKSQDVDRLFLRKLSGFRREERAKHIGYVFAGQTDRIPLPPLMISRGSGDVGAQVVRSLADSFGMSRESFELGAQCRICADCFWLCFAAKIVLDATARYSRDPIAYNKDFVGAAIRAADKLLAQLSDTERRAWTRTEQAELSRVRAAINRIVKYDDVLEFETRWLGAVG